MKKISISRRESQISTAGQKQIITSARAADDGGDGRVGTGCK